VAVWAPDRAGALARMRRALDECDIAGPAVHTTAGFLRTLLDDPLFVAAKHDTALVDGLTADGRTQQP
jgi:acetyl-CoA carboxylase biotin carboxylase subunit